MTRFYRLQCALLKRWGISRSPEEIEADYSRRTGFKMSVQAIRFLLWKFEKK